jgi:WD40 repeat protein
VYLLRSLDDPKPREIRHNSTVSALTFSPTDPDMLITGTLTGDLSAWLPDSNDPFVRWRAHRGVITGVAFDGRGSRLVSGGLDRGIFVWIFPTPEHRQTISREMQALRALIADSKDGIKDGIMYDPTALIKAVRSTNDKTLVDRDCKELFGSVCPPLP